MSRPSRCIRRRHSPFLETETPLTSTSARLPRKAPCALSTGASEAAAARTEASASVAPTQQARPSLNEVAAPGETLPPWSDESPRLLQNLRRIERKPRSASPGTGRARQGRDAGASTRRVAPEGGGAARSWPASRASTSRRRTGCPPGPQRGTARWRLPTGSASAPPGLAGLRPGARPCKCACRSAAGGAAWRGSCPCQPLRPRAARG